MIAQLVDTVLDRTLVGYTSLGPGIRSRLSTWPADAPADALRGMDAAVTGATSGLGLATALDLAAYGARTHLVVRTPAKAAPVKERIEREVPGAEVLVHRCDVADLDDVRRFAAEFLSADDGAAGHGLDVLVHNAGQMPPERTESAQHHELTMACHVLGPVLMTDLLQPVLSGGRVVLVTSGGMYAQGLRADDPEYLTGDYSPTTAYARSKRAQVELLPLLAQRWAPTEVWATHPGWADTPGVLDSLPTFHRILGPLLRDAAGGADTTSWLAAVDPAPPSGGLWHDRRQRPTHVLAKTRPGPGDVDELWAWVQGAIGG